MPWGRGLVYGCYWRPASADIFKLHFAWNFTGEKFPHHSRDAIYSRSSLLYEEVGLTKVRFDDCDFCCWIPMRLGRGPLFVSKPRDQGLEGHGKSVQTQRLTHFDAEQLPDLRVCLHVPPQHVFDRQRAKGQLRWKRAQSGDGRDGIGHVSIHRDWRVRVRYLWWQHRRKHHHALPTLYFGHRWTHCNSTLGDVGVPATMPPGKGVYQPHHTPPLRRAPRRSTKRRRERIKRSEQESNRRKHRQRQRQHRVIETGAKHRDIHPGRRTDRGVQRTATQGGALGRSQVCSNHVMHSNILLCACSLSHLVGPRVGGCWCNGVHLDLVHPTGHFRIPTDRLRIRKHQRNAMENKVDQIHRFGAHMLGAGGDGHVPQRHLAVRSFSLTKTQISRHSICSGICRKTRIEHMQRNMAAALSKGPLFLSTSTLFADRSTNRGAREAKSQKGRRGGGGGAAEGNGGATKKPQECWPVHITSRCTKQSSFTRMST